MYWLVHHSENCKSQIHHAENTSYTIQADNESGIGWGRAEVAVVVGGVYAVKAEQTRQIFVFTFH